MGQNQSSFDEDLDESKMNYYNPMYLDTKLPKLPNKADHGGRAEFENYSRHHGSGLLESLPIELILQILSKMEINTLLKMARVSKNWNRLANQDILFQKATVSRFHIHPSRFYYLGLNPHQKSHKWKDLYAELDSGISTWSGYALDYVTNSGRPYEMELIIKSTDSKLVRGPYGLSDKSNFFRLTQFEGCCRWRTLADSLTNTEGAIVDPEGNSSIRFHVDPYLAAYFPRHITFTETGVVRGLDLVVPNLYQGLVCENVVLGSYDPGHPDLVGSFICVLQDSLPLDRFRTDQFKPLKEYKGIWMTSLDKAIYMHFTVEKANSGKISGTAQLFPFVSCRTTTRQGKVELENCVNLELQFQVDLSDDKSPSVSNGQFSLVESSFYDQLWVQDCVPISQVIHMNLNGETITGLFSDPRPGCFYLNPIN